MKVKLRFFASIKEMIGVSEEEIDISVGSTLETLITQVSSSYAKLATLEKILVAINGSYVDLETVIAEGDVVAFFPPVSGG